MLSAAPLIERRLTVGLSRAAGPPPAIGVSAQTSVTFSRSFLLNIFTNLAKGS